MLSHVLSNRSRLKFLLLFEVGVFFPKTLHTSGGVHQLLFPGKERVTVSADFDREPFFRRASRILGATGTSNDQFVVLWMNTVFHEAFLSYRLEQHVAAIRLHRHSLPGGGGIYRGFHFPQEESYKENRAAFATPHFFLPTLISSDSS